MTDPLQLAGQRYLRQRDQDLAMIANQLPAKERRRLLEKIAIAARVILDGIERLDSESRDHLSLLTGRIQEFERDLEGVAGIEDGARRALQAGAQRGPRRRSDALAIFVADLCMHWEWLNHEPVTLKTMKAADDETVLTSPAGAFIAQEVRRFDPKVEDASIAAVLRNFLETRSIT